MNRFFPAIATIAAGLTLGASVLQAGSAQAAIFYDFKIQWDDDSITTGWVQVDDTPDEYRSRADYNYQYWNLSSLLDANFTHKGTLYGKSDITSLDLAHYDFVAGSVAQGYFGSVLHFLDLNFGDQYLSAADGGSDENFDDFNSYAYKYKSSSFTGYATVTSIAERPQSVPEPTTIAGLAFVGIGIFASQRKRQTTV